MFCNQCEETLNCEGCVISGVCGKRPDVANLQDEFVVLLASISYLNQLARKHDLANKQTNKFICAGLFATITNANFDASYFEKKIIEGLAIREQLKKTLLSQDLLSPNLPKEINYSRPELKNAIEMFSEARKNDLVSLRSLIVFGVKGMSAYTHHAAVLGFESEEIYSYMEEGLAAALDESLGLNELMPLVLKCGEIGVKTMALLDQANTSTFGIPEPTKVNIGVRNRPGILISGHDLKDLHDLLEQTKGTGVDVYTHCEMLPAHSYPLFKKYDNLVGNYGGSWWHQPEEFEKFNGPILMTTNCIVPPRDSYRGRIYTTGVVGYDGLKYIPEGIDGKKDFSAIIAQAKTSEPPVQLEEGYIPGGFAHDTILNAAPKIIELIQKGSIKKFVVMAGCDGRQKDRQYYTDFASKLPNDAVVLTAGCAKYRYNKLNLGDIEGIPRVLDAGQCNDSYSLAVVALKLTEVLGAKSVNDLPIVFNIAWYEQKAVLVLLALLSLGVKNITLGPKLPAFISPNVLGILVETFGLRPNTTVDQDMEMMIGTRAV